MMPKSGHRYSEKIMLPNRLERDDDSKKSHHALVPRTRSSRIPCREFDRELRVQRGTRILELLVVLDSEVRKRGCRTNDANFGIGPLVPVGLGADRQQGAAEL